MSSRKLEDLTNEVFSMAIVHRKLCKERGVELLIYCTLRSNEEQDELYSIGRTKPGKIVTKARAGQSAHNPDEYGLAWGYDCVPMVGGKPMWNSKELYNIVGECGEAAGLSWSGRWKGSLKEVAHFQHKEWRKK